MRFLKYLSLLAFTIVLILSCQHDRDVTPDPVQDATRVPTLNEILEGAEDARVTQEPVTLAEVNEVMQSMGFEPYTQDYIDSLIAKYTNYTTEAIIRSCSTNCTLICSLGDWNESGTLTAYDVALAKQYCCNNGGGCSSPFELDLSGGGWDIEAYKFAAVSLYTHPDCDEQYLLNDKDMDIVTLKILGSLDDFGYCPDE